MEKTMDEQKVIHITMNSQYRIVIERAASSTKGIDGFKVEANGDSLEKVERDVVRLYRFVLETAHGEESVYREVPINPEYPRASTTFQGV